MWQWVLVWHARVCTPASRRSQWVVFLCTLSAWRCTRGAVMSHVAVHGWGAPLLFVAPALACRDWLCLSRCLVRRRALPQRPARVVWPCLFGYECSPADTFARQPRGVDLVPLDGLVVQPAPPVPARDAGIVDDAVTADNVCRTATDRCAGRAVRFGLQRRSPLRVS